MQVVAVGGSASVGKTTLALAIAGTRAFDQVAHVDDLRAAVEVSDGPSFIEATPDVWRMPVRWLCAQLTAETQRVHPLITAKVDAFLADGYRGVVEGEGVEPSLFLRWPASVVRPVYVIEDDADRLHATFARRSSGARFLALSRSDQDAVVEMNRMYGAWLREQAEAYGQVWVPSHPWDTMPERTLTAIAA